MCADISQISSNPLINSGISSANNAIMDIPEEIIKNLSLSKTIFGIVQNDQNSSKEFIIKTSDGELKINSSLKLKKGIEVGFKVSSNNQNNIQFELISLKKPDQEQNLIAPNSRNFLIFTFTKNQSNLTLTNTETTTNKLPTPYQSSISPQQNINQAILISKTLEVNEEAIPKLINDIKDIRKLFIESSKFTPKNLDSNKEFAVQFLVNKMKDGGFVNFKIIKSDEHPLTFNSKIIGYEQDFAIIKNDLGLFQIKDKNGQFINHKTLNLKLTSIIPNKNPSNSSTPNIENISQIIQNWNSLDKAFQSLNKFQPKNADNLIKNIIPNFMNEPTEENIASKIAHFIHHLKNSDAKSWMGEKLIKSLEKVTINTGQEFLIRNIQEDFSLLKKLLNDETKTNNITNKTNGWHSLFFPISDGKELNQIAIYIRNQDLREDHNSEEHENLETDSKQHKDTRFIVEIETKLTGKIQLDGIVIRSKNENKTLERPHSFDLKINSNQEIPITMQNDIKIIFNNINEISGINGQINFNILKNFPNSPIIDILSNQDKSSILV